MIILKSQQQGRQKMKSKLLTTTFILSSLLAGSGVMAMDLEPAEEGDSAKNLAVQQLAPVVTEETFLTQSMYNPDAVRAMMKALDKNATTEDQEAGQKAIQGIKEKAAAKQQAKFEQPQESLSKEEEGNFRKFVSWLFSSEKQEEKTEESAESSTPVTPQAQAEETETPNTSVTTVEVEKSAEAEKSYGIFDRRYWGFGKSDEAVVTATPETKEEEKPQTPSTTTEPTVTTEQSATDTEEKPDTTVTTDTTTATSTDGQS